MRALRSYRAWQIDSCATNANFLIAKFAQDVFFSMALAIPPLAVLLSGASFQSSEPLPPEKAPAAVIFGMEREKILAVREVMERYEVYVELSLIITTLFSMLLFGLFILTRFTFYSKVKLRASELEQREARKAP